MRFRASPLSFGILLSFFAVTEAARATSITWTNTSGGNWNLAANWNPNQVPGPDDDVAIQLPLDMTVVMDVSATIHNLVLGSTSGSSTQTLVVNGVVLTANGSASVQSRGVVSFGGLFASPNTNVVEGTWNWNLGTLSPAGGQGTLLIKSGGHLNITGTGLHEMPGFTLVNEGSVLWEGGPIRNGQNGEIENRGAWVASNGGIINNAWGGSPVFKNSGRFEVQAGSVSLDLIVQGNGIFRAATNALCLFTTAGLFDSGTQFLGEGINRFSGGVHLVSGVFTSENLELLGATLDGTNTLVGHMSWIVGSLAQLAVLTIEENSTLNILSTSLHEMNRATLVNKGTVSWEGGTIRNGFEGGIQNRGLWISTAGGSINNAWGGQPVFNNSGIFDLRGGSMSFDLPVAGAGTFRAATNTLCLFPSNDQFGSGVAFVGEGTHRVTGGTQVFTGDVTGDHIELAGGTWDGTNTLHGTLTWGGGSLAVGSALTVDHGSTLNIVGSGFHEKNRAQLNNLGTVVWDGGSVRNGFEGGILNQGTWIATAGGSINNAWGGTPIFDNLGTMVVQSGAMSFDMQVHAKGAIQVAANASCSFTADDQFEDGTSLTGDGLTRFTFGNQTVAGRIEIQNLEFAAGKIFGDGLFDAPSASTAVFTWSGGDLGNPGTTTIGKNTTLVIAGASNHDLFSHRIVNNGTVSWTGGAIQGGQGSVFQNAGQWLITGDHALNNAWGGAGTFLNSGLVRQISGTTLITHDFTNKGDVEVASGAGLTFKSNSQVPIVQTSGSITLSGGTIESSTPLQLRGGVLRGGGTVRSDVVNSAKVLASRSGGSINIVGNYSQSLGGELEFELAGTTPGSSYSQITVTGKASLRGTITLDWLNGFVPGDGDLFTPMTYGSVAGQFQCSNGFFLLGKNRRLAATYGPTQLTLKSIAAPDPTAPTLTVFTADKAALVCWPIEFSGFRLESSDDVASPHWSPVALNGSSAFLANTDTDGPQQFFRLVKP